MADNVNLEVLSTRSGFNTAVRHIKKTIDLASQAGAGNLGDIVHQMEDEEMTSARVGLLLRMLLVDKMGYKTASANLAAAVDDLDKLSSEFQKWNGVDLVAAYYHPELGLLIANPKSAEDLSGFGELRKRELLVVYAGLQGRETDDSCQKAAELALGLFEGAKVTVPASLTKGKFITKKTAKPKKAAENIPAKTEAVSQKAKTEKNEKSDVKGSAPAVKTAAVQAAAVSGPVKMTPRYAVVVQNELFHNGNVEAWKRIIASYKAKHPNLEVYIYYEGERILDINSLFKWGKVKHGSAIEFAVAGNEIHDVAKLQRYLAQGASHMFEAFLRGPVNAVLKLF
ncbi:MAG: hypothetical protein LBH16_05090 [Treponema sp.]|jgi:hypothetical protein|nr:hypothetical protein [Treponema sp.]